MNAAANSDDASASSPIEACRSGDERSLQLAMFPDVPFSRAHLGAVEDENHPAQFSALQNAAGIDEGEIL